MWIRWICLLVATIVFNSISGQDRRQDEFFDAKQFYEDFLQKHSHIYHSNQADLHYLSWGNKNHPTILWLHGSYSNAIEIEPFVNELVKSGFHIISLNYYGHGLTKSNRPTPSLVNFLEEIDNLLHTLKKDKVIIGGFSRGGYIATNYYNKYPNRVKALILEDSGVSPFLGFLKSKNEDELQTYMDNEIKNRPPALFAFYDTEIDAYYAIREYGDTSTTNLYKNFVFISPIRNQYKLYNGLDTIYGMESYDSLQKLLNSELVENPFANDLVRPNYLQIIQQSKIPILLLEATSSTDYFDDKEYYDGIVNRNVTRKTFRNSSHHIKFEEPEEFINTVILFLKTLKL